MNLASVNQRFWALAIDYAILAIISFLIFHFGFNEPSDSTKLGYFVFALNIVFFLKDVFGQSPGKKILKIKIVDLKGNRVNPIAAIIRDLFLIIGCIEILVVISRKDRLRLADVITNSRVVNE